MQKKEYSLSLSGKTLTAQFTDLADQANGSVLVRLGNTIVLATAVMSEEIRDGLGYFPLTVDYEEKFYAAGQILGSRFIRREGRPSDEAVLSGRLVDRTVRPLFEKHIRNDVQVVITILSIDEDDPDVIAVLAASLALGTSDIPWQGPVSAIRIGKRGNGPDFIVNPTYALREGEECELDLIACGKDGTINMIEAGGREAEETVLTAALEKALMDIERLETFQKDIIAEIGKEKRRIEKPAVPDELALLFKNKIGDTLESALFSGPGKAGIKKLTSEWLSEVAQRLPEVEKQIAIDYFEERVNERLHAEAIDNKRRPDGRSLDELRPLYAQAGGLSPILHGSGIFYRGGTHILSALTLGGPGDSQVVDGMEIQTKKRFMHHYNFPPFSTGETGRLGGMNRRMIGHGALAEKALVPVLPPKEKFPYTIRIVSEAMASNGSTSMGSVCASTLALMDAGVPLRTPVAGIASGIMMRKKTSDSGYEYALLTDIQGPEDEHGDMDLKVAGTRRGVTAIQMDVKVDGIPVSLLDEALRRAKQARLQILEVIENEIKEPRSDISPNAPKIVSVTIKPSQIGMVIGPGGKMINEIREKTGTEIDIEEDGTVFITGKADGPEKAKKIIEEMTREYKPGDRLTGTVTKVVDFGAFVKIGPNTEGLVHVSEIAPFRINDTRAVLTEGQKVPVAVKEVNGGKISLSIKNADPHFLKNPSQN